MTENPKKPREDDGVLGGQNPPPVNAAILRDPKKPREDAAILRGIEGVKRRLAYPDVEVRVAALSSQ